MAVERRNDIPVSQQIRGYLVRRIVNGDLAPGAQVPSETQLAEMFATSRMTVNRVMKELAIAGRLRRVQGLGTFVADKAPLAPIFEIRSIAQEIKRRGASHSCEVISNEVLPAGMAEAERLDVAPGTPVFRLMALHRSDGAPIQVERRLVNSAVCPEFGAQDFTRETALDYIMGQVSFTEVEHEIDAVAPLPESCEMLGIAPGVPCLRLMHRAWVGARVATYALLTHPSAAYRLGGRTGVVSASSGQTPQ